MSRLKLDFCGLKLNSPIVLLSGCVGFGEEYTRVEGFSNRDVGAIVLKGTTLAPRLGNPPHRVWETPAGMLNAIGLQNPGVDHVVKSILPTLDFKETRFIANVCGSTIEEYAEVTRRFDDSPIDAMEINISCPNVKEGGVAFGNYPDMSARVVAACRAVTKKPLITKLSPNQTDIRLNARACIDAGTDAFAVINTLMGMAIDVETRQPIIGNIQGGLSGPAIRPIALLKVHQVRGQMLRRKFHDGRVDVRAHDLRLGKCLVDRTSDYPRYQLPFRVFAAAEAQMHAPPRAWRTARIAAAPYAGGTAKASSA